MQSFWLFLTALAKNKGALIGLMVIIFVVFTAIFADVISPYSPSEQYRDAFLRPPFWSANGSFEHLLGTDAVGRDLYSRIIHGARYSMLIGALVVVISLVIGILIGVISGYVGGILDFMIMRIIDILLAFPSLLLALVVATILGPGLTSAIIAVTIVQLPHFIRLTRAGIIQEKSKDYYIASKVLGASPLRLMIVTLLPNSFSPLIVQATLNFSNAILDAAALGFLGLGAQPPLPEWGAMLADSREFILSAWWVITFPGLAIMLVVLSINIFGDGLRDVLDPRLKKV